MSKVNYGVRDSLARVDIDDAPVNGPAHANQQDLFRSGGHAGEDRQVRTRLAFSDGKTDRLAGMSANDTPRPIGRVGIIGANAIGVGIAMHLLNADIPVTMFELTREPLDEGIALARSSYQDSVTNGELALDKRDRRMALLVGTVHFHHLKDCDLIIDAVFTDMGVKEKLFRRLDEVAKPDAILGTCTSHSELASIAGFTKRPDKVLGLHFFGLANATETWDLVQGDATSGETLASAIALGRQLRKADALSSVWGSVQANWKDAEQLLDQSIAAWRSDQTLE